MLHEYAYFGQEVNFHDMLQVQPLEEYDIADPTMEDLPSLLPIKKYLTFPQEELLNINIDTTNKERLLQIGVALVSSKQERYKSKFITCSKIFAWSYDDMPGLYPSFFMNNLPLKVNAKPIKQKPRKMHPFKALLVKKEIEKYLQAGFI